MKTALLVLFALLSLTITAMASVDHLRFPVSVDWERLPERVSPKDRIAEQDVLVTAQRIVINLPGAQWATFTDTNSMDPLFDQGANTLEVKPGHPDDIEVGDIISYYHDQGIIVHRVVDKGEDEQGTYYIVKGDNASQSDPLKVRFEQIHGVVVGILY